MKKFFIMILFPILVLLTGCNDVYKSISFTNTEDYEQIWYLSERRDDNSLAIFPSSLNNFNVTSFICNWKSYKWTGSGFEICLTVKYDKQSMNDEINRISSISSVRKTKYDTSNFLYPAYVATLGYLDSNEYALIDEDNQTVYYIYLQLMDKEDITINKSLLPKNYEDMGKVDEYSYTIYSDFSNAQDGY